MSKSKFKIQIPTPVVEEGKKHTKIAIHTVSQFYGDNKQLSLFSDEKIDAFSRATGHPNCFESSRPRVESLLDSANLLRLIALSYF